MRALNNRITISLAVIFCLSFTWEYWIRPQASPLYTEAVTHYRAGHYEQSLELLNAAYRIDPNDAAVLSLLGWNHLKLNDARRAEPYFRRAHTLAPETADILLGYAYAELELHHYDEAIELLKALGGRGQNTADVHIAWATLYRDGGQYRDAVREFQLALALDESNELAARNLREILNTSGDVRQVRTEFRPLERPKELVIRARVEKDYFSWQGPGGWQPVYLVGVDLTPSLPGHFPADAVTDPALYEDWLRKISDLGANSIRVYTILPPAFYRSLARFNQTSGRPALRVLQGITLGDPPVDDFFDPGYYSVCQKEIRNTIDAFHGQADLGKTSSHGGGVFTEDVAPWIAGVLVGHSWSSHTVIANNQIHSSLKSFRGAYVEVPAGNATEVFLAQMIDFAALYEEAKYNAQRPIAFVNVASFDPMLHPTDSTFYEEASLRRANGERFSTPDGPHDDDDAVTLNPMHLRALPRFAAGYFSAYSVFPYYPDFITHEPNYSKAEDTVGVNPFFGYLRDLKAHHAGIPLIISEYGIPTSLGVGHFAAAGFDQGGLTEAQQGQALARMTHNIFDAGAAGGLAFEWLDTWSRRNWIVRNFEVPEDRKPLWSNCMDPAEDFGLIAAEPRLSLTHRLEGNPSDWADMPPIYSESHQGLFRTVGDRFDPARHLKALYADADEGFLYLRLVVEKLDNDNDGVTDWNEANYLIGISTAPGQAGLTKLPFIEALRFPMGMTYAIQLAGPASSRLWVASSYNPYHLTPVNGVPGETALTLKLGWQPKVTSAGIFEAEIIEPNRRRFGRNRQYFPPRRYERGLLRYGSLAPQSPDYDTLAQWHANILTNSIDLRIPWNLLNVTDPSSLKVFAGTEPDGSVRTSDTRGFLMAVFSYRPNELSRARSIMQQAHPVADVLPGFAKPGVIAAADYKYFRWKGWDRPGFHLRTKDSYLELRQAFNNLPRLQPGGDAGPTQWAQAKKSSSPQSTRLEELQRQVNGQAKTHRRGHAGVKESR